MAVLIPWEDLEAEYTERLNAGIGGPDKSFQIALGALIIKEKSGTSDIETVEQIRENPISSSQHPTASVVCRHPARIDHESQEK
jgi:hypothetical protein